MKRLLDMLTFLSLLVFISAATLWWAGHGPAEVPWGIDFGHHRCFVSYNGTFSYRAVSEPPPAGMPAQVRGAGFVGFGSRHISCTAGGSSYSADVPAWFPLIASAALPAWWCCRKIRFRERTAAGLCPNCGYDLRATPDRCPECGEKPTGRTGLACMWLFALLVAGLVGGCASPRPEVFLEGRLAREGYTEAELAQLAKELGFRPRRLGWFTPDELDTAVRRYARQHSIPFDFRGASVEVTIARERDHLATVGYYRGLYRPYFSAEIGWDGTVIGHSLDTAVAGRTVARPSVAVTTPTP